MVAAAIHHHTRQDGPRPSSSSCPTVPVNLLLLQAGPETPAVQSQFGNKFTFPLVARIQTGINEMVGNREAR